MKTTLATLAIFALVVAGYFLFARTAAAPVSDEVAAPAAKTLALATSTLAEEGTDYSVSVEYPQFGDEAIDVQIRDAVAGAAAELKTQAAKDTPVSGGFRKYEFIGMYSDVHIGSDVVSFRQVFAQDTGGAHPLPVVEGFNFDAKTGMRLTLDDALTFTGLTLAQVAAGAKTQLVQQLGDIMFPEGAEAKSENYGTFLVSKDTVVFIFQPYQVAAYAAGTPEVTFARK